MSVGKYLALLEQLDALRRSESQIKQDADNAAASGTLYELPTAELEKLDQEEDSLLDKMDMVWFQLSQEEIDEIEEYIRK